MLQYIIAGIALVLMCVIPLVITCFAFHLREQQRRREIEIAERELEIAEEQLRLAIMEAKEAVRKIEGDNE